MVMHEAMGVYLLVGGFVYQAHYKAGSRQLCRVCDLLRPTGGCLVSGYKREVCTSIDCYWRKMDE